MTAQIGDTLKFQDREFSIVAMKPPLQFYPEKYNITPEMICTACRKGFWCSYNISDGSISLEDLYINSKNNFYPEIEGVFPQPSDGTKIIDYMFHHLYKNLNIKILYSGKILAGDEFISDYYIHMGYQRPWAYKTLKELVFKCGELMEINDQSQIATKMRERIDSDKDFCKNLRESGEDASKFINDSFSLDFKTKAWWLENN